MKKAPFYVLDRKGTLINKFASYGNGPTEINQVWGKAFYSNKKIYVQDISKKKIQIFDGKEMIADIKVLKNFKYFASNSKNELFILNEDEYDVKNSAISKYKDNELVKTWGEIPLGGIFNRIHVGGGICLDNADNIYYSYIGDYRIWKYSSDGKLIKIFDQRPKGAISVENNIKTMDHMDAQGQFFKVTRVAGLFIISPKYVLQQIRHPKTGKNKSPIINIVYDIDGNVLDVSTTRALVISTYKNEILSLPLDNNEDYSKLEIYRIVYE